MQHNRKIDGGVCALCKRPVGIISINGKSVEVEDHAVIWDDVVVVKLHLCRKAPADDLGDVERGPVVKNGRKVKR